MSSQLRSYRLFSAMLKAQSAATLLAWFFALGDIETIMFFGPVLSLTGVTISLFAQRQGLLQGALFGLGVPALAILCFALIYLNGWSPDAAYDPINFIVAVFLLAQVPICGLVIADAERRQFRPAEKFNYQFSIAGIMLFTAFVAATLGLQRAFGFSGLTLAVLLWHVVVIGWFIWKAPVRAPRQPVEQPISEIDVKES